MGVLRTNIIECREAHGVPTTGHCSAAAGVPGRVFTHPQKRNIEPEVDAEQVLEDGSRQCRRGVHLVPGCVLACLKVAAQHPQDLHPETARSTRRTRWCAPTIPARKEVTYLLGNAGRRDGKDRPRGLSVAANPVAASRRR